MDLRTAHATLGVESTTPLDEVRRRYRLRAQMLHPDRLEGDTDLSTEATQAMADLNVAWDLIREADRQGLRNRDSALTDSPSSAPTAHSDARPPGLGECDLCGAHPAGIIEFRGVVGLLLFWRTKLMRLDLCRACAFSMLREVQADTLTKGWWGFIFLGGYIATLWNVTGNILRFRRHHRLVGPMVGRDPDVVTPIPPGIPPGPPIHRRPGPVLASGAAAALVGLLFYAATTDEDPSGGPPPAEERDPPPGVEVGTCFDRQALIVDCRSPEAYAVIASKVVTPEQCVAPYTALTLGEDHYCVYITP